MSIITFHLGYEAANNDFFPVTHFYERHFGAEKVSVPKPPLLTPTQLEYSVYSDISEKERIPCPDTKQVFVIAIFGQSNAANGSGHRFSNQDNRLVNFFNGDCYVANDPMLGASGIQGSVWIPFLKNLDTDKDILVINFAIGGSSIRQWLDSDSLAPLYAQNMQSLVESGYNPDLFLWIQGEADALTEEEIYEKSLNTLILKIKNEYPVAKIGLSSTSYCRQQSSEIIARVQHRIALFQDLIWLGNTDKFNSSEYRYDDCHFSGEGAKEVASMFSLAINKAITDN